MPGRLIAQINASLDGYIEDEKHDIDWHFVDYEEFINETLRSLDGMIFGRKAYEPLSAYWPTAAANPDASVRHLEAATLMHEIPKYVVSTTRSGSDWNNTDVISGDVRTAVQDLKAASSRDIAVFVGGRVISSLTDYGLVDEYRITVNPILLGAGTPLFSGRMARRPLTLVMMRPFRSGAIVLTYQPAHANQGNDPEGTEHEQ